MLSMGSTYNSSAYGMYPAAMMGQMAGMGQSPDMGMNLQMAGHMLMQSGGLYQSAMNLLGTTQSPTAYPTPFYAQPVACMPVIAYMPVICQVPVMSATPVSTQPPAMMPANPVMAQPLQHPPVQTPPVAPPTQTSPVEQYEMLSYLIPLLMELLQQLSAPTPQEQAPPPPPPVYNGGNDGRYWGDPHLEGFDGEKYDVMGQSGKIYNMLSDKNIQYNTTFAQWGKGDATVISEAGVQVGEHKIFFDRSGKAPTLNGQPLTTGETATLDNGSTASWDGKKLTVKTQEYTIDLAVKDQNNPNGAYLDSHVSINEAGPFADFVSPHGLLGQTADGVDGQKDSGRDQGKQGGRVIDGTVTDYEVTDLWSIPAQFNRFGSAIGQIIQNEETGAVEKVLDTDGNLLFKAAPLSIAA